MSRAFDLKTPLANTFNDEQRWQAVLNRDASQDNRFVFAVTSTGVFCRPSCPSRRPRQDRVRFFSSTTEARQAGFRACKRCKPEQEHSNPHMDLVKRACRYLEGTDNESVKLAHLAERLGVSSFHLQRTFKAVMGISPRQYLAAQRFGSFKSQVREGKNVTTALYDAGFNSSSRLYEQASAELGMTPATYSRGGRGATITYTIAPCQLGKLLVARTAKGICAVRMADTDPELERELRDEFPAAEIVRDDSSLKEIVQKVVTSISNPQEKIVLPLDIQATAFQRRVWEQLRAIPAGKTMSYGAVARAVGNPAAVRAVGRACATNPVALVIPCHRVVREDQTLGGYRWGLDRKKQLLESERVAARDDSHD